MAKINGLDKMSYAELRELRDLVDDAMTSAQARDRQDLKAKIAELASESGFDLDELFGGGKRGKGGSLKGSTVAVKYRNPKDASQTWTGRGRKPNWLIEALKKGQKIESFTV